MKDLHNELNKLTEAELKLVIGVCQFVIDTLSTILVKRTLEEEEEE